MLSYATTNIRQLIGDEWSILPLKPEPSDVRDLAVGDDEIWLVDARGDDFFLVRYVSDQGATPTWVRVEATPLPGEALLLRSSAGVFVVLTHFPYTILRVGSDSIRSSRVDWSSLGIEDGSDNSVFATALLSVGCHAKLVLLTDLRSDKRWLALFDARDLRFLRADTLVSPFGLAHGMDDGRSLLGYVDDNPGGVVLFEASWTKESYQ
ncbi:MAG: hypothetical protein RLN75_03630 [Longimicrobiales bacterium]